MLRKFFYLQLILVSTLSFSQNKPKLTIDDFFSWVEITSVRMSPDGDSIVMVTDRPDWDQNIFREDLWLYRDKVQPSLIQLTQSEHDSEPQWSPDGKWVAFLSERKKPGGKDSDSGGDKDSDEGDTNQVYLISPDGGEAVQITSGDEEVHAFTWAADSRSIFYATRTPWTKAEKDTHKKDWKDVKQYRGDERGDMIFGINVTEARQFSLAHQPKKSKDDSDENPDVTPESRSVGTTPFRVHALTASADGHRLAFSSTSISQREEKVGDYEIYVIDLTNASPERAPRRVTNNQAEEEELRWAPDNRHLFFETEQGSVEGKYEDTQRRLYWVDADSGKYERWAADFPGAVLHYAIEPGGSVVACGRIGTEVQLYTQVAPSKPFVKKDGWPGTYEGLAGSLHSNRIAFVYSSLEKPNELFIADGSDKVPQAQQITSFNKLFADRDLPKGNPYRWTADDGTTVEGMLMYPPGKFEAKNLPMFVFIHGGPNDADGNHFEADWYVWDRLAATQGWLVFEPNYRGSNGYGDKFLMEIVPQIVSRPGKDILEGVDALVNEGVANPNRLAIGGYSYGGYMTNWLITQKTWKAAVTGAGAVEHISNWGNDDTSYDDVYFLGGLPWQEAKRYHDEAAIFQMDKVHTPTHIVAGADDIRVAVGEDYLLDHALYNLGIPHELLIFPGEGHDLGKNPWHGKIKVREELKWLQKYGGVGQPVSGE